MEIHNWQTGEGSILGTFTVYVPALGLSLHKLKAIRSKKGSVFIAFPSYSEEIGPGEKKWSPYISFSEQRSQEFQKKCLELIQDYIQLVDQKRSVQGDKF